MAGSFEVHMGGAGPLVARRATGPEAGRLRATGERLAQAAHPGVVEVLRSVGTDDGWELQLTHAGRPAALLSPLPPSQVAALAAAVAATLADLHRSGVVHGHLDASHVLVGAQGRPVLCGFGPDDGGAGPADDVAAVGALIEELLGAADAELIPERRWGRRRSPDWARRSLLLLADHACAEPPSRRPTAARLAAAIASTVPGAHLVEPELGDLAPAASPAAVDPLDALRATSDEVAGPRPRSLSSIGAAAVALGALVLGVGVLRPPASSTPSVTPTTVPPPTTVPSPTTVTSTTGPVAVAGTVVTVGPHRFEVGQPGDRVVVGDWDCDGVVTAAALRPSTGEVFVFPTWTSGPDVVVSAVARIDAAVDLMAGPPAGVEEGCAGLSVRRRDGSVVAVPLADTA